VAILTNKLTEQERLQYAGTLNAQHAQEESWLCTAFKHLSVEEKRTIIRECMEKGFINNLKKFMSEK
jgi:hypothetical protein